jgi:hypothetical protein
VRARLTCSRVALAIAALACALCLAATARAHGMRSAYLELHEIAPGRVVARFALTARAPGVTPRFPPHCAVEADARAPAAIATSPGDSPSITRLACRAPLAGSRVTVDGLGPLITEASVLVLFADGSSASALLTSDAPSWEIAPAAGARATLGRYVSLGVSHILLGADHLLFLLLLVLTLGRVRGVLLAEAAFTVSHSLSFTATALGLVRVSPLAAEACIALSLLLVALDVGRSSRRMTDRAAASLAFVFGLVHGLGFAGGLREIGLPDDHAAWALAGFGCGVELGQLAFLGVALLAFHLVTRAGWRARVSELLARAIGGIASYWLIERVLACLHAA